MYNLNNMKTAILKHIRILFALVLIVSLLITQACSVNTESNISSSETSELNSSNENSSQAADLSPFNYETGNHYQSNLLKSVVSDAAIKAAYDVIDAFIEHKTSVKVEFEGHYGAFTEELGFVLSCIYPPFAACAEYNAIKAYNEKDGTVSWKYKYEKSVCDEMQSACEKVTENYMSKLRQGDNDTEKALLLYNALISNAVYDYDVLLIDTEKEYETFDKRTTAYNALVNKSGICYSYSFALVYLYMRAGINCITVSSQEGEGAHMWVMVDLDGKYYYIDPTWDIGGGFYHFGMTSQDRASWAGAYAEDTCFAFTTPISGNYVLDSERFFDMRSYILADGFYNIELDREKNQAVISNDSVTYRLDCQN